MWRCVVNGCPVVFVGRSVVRLGWGTVVVLVVIVGRPKAVNVNLRKMENAFKIKNHFQH